MSSRLFTKLREEQGLAYAVGSSLSTNVLDGAFIAYIGTNANSVDKAKMGILAEIDTIKNICCLISQSKPICLNLIFI